jgi:serpin B
VGFARLSHRRNSSRVLLNSSVAFLHFRLKQDKLAALIQDLSADGIENSFRIRLANAVWVQRDYPVRDAYRTMLREVFALEDDFGVDFTGHPTEAARTINDWVANRTGGRIRSVVEPERAAAPSKMFLASALYFRGNWTEGFYRPNTRNAEFHVTRSRSVTVPMMSQTSYLRVQRYLDAGSFQVLSLECGQGAYAMVVLLPKQVDGLASLEETLTPRLLDALWPKLKTRHLIYVKLPRFRLETSLRLQPTLESLGLSRAFERARADFSGINGRSGDLFVSDAIHETVLDVNEEGVEGAASTGVLCADGDDDDPPAIVNVDHPFLYLIRDTRSGCVVFFGRVINPMMEFNPPHSDP